MARVIPVVLSIALTVFALADCIQTDEDRVRGIPRWAWILLIVFVPWAGPLTWLFIGKERGRGGFGNPNPRPARREGPLAPDEDPEFLRKLDEDIRRERRERLRAQKEREAREAQGMTQSAGDERPGSTSPDDRADGRGADAGPNGNTDATDKGTDKSAADESTADDDGPDSPSGPAPQH